MTGECLRVTKIQAVEFGNAFFIAFLCFFERDEQEVAVPLGFGTLLGFKFFLVVLASLVVLLFDIGEINYIAKTHVLVGTIDPGKGLQQVVVLDYTMQV